MPLPHFKNIRSYKNYSVVIYYCSNCYNTKHSYNEKCDICGGILIHELITNFENFDNIKKLHLRWLKLNRITYGNK